MNGDLSDINLVDLIQMICLKQRDNVVLALKNGGAAGSIFFDQGDVIHAEVGSLVGESAFYQLLTWKSGTFQLDPFQDYPRRSVTLSWGPLLMEAMRLMNEKTVPRMAVKHTENPRRLTPEELANDKALEADLVQLFIALERFQAQLTEKRTRKAPDLAMRCLAEMINGIYSVCQKWVDLSVPGNTLDGSIEILAETNPALRALQIQRQALAPASIGRLLPKRDAQKGISQATDSLLALLNVHLQHLTGLFHTNESKAQWEEMRATFLSDINRLFDASHF